MTPHLERLRAPFAQEQIEWRVQQAGEGRQSGRIYARVTLYVTNRAIQTRLDETVGAAGWKNEFVQGPEGGVLCGLWTKTDGEWVTNGDGAENTDTEGVKGGLSGDPGDGRSCLSLRPNHALRLENAPGQLAPEDATPLARPRRP